MKFIVKKIAVSLVSALVFSAMVTVAANAAAMQQSFDADLYKNVVRLHIPANSDSEYDQKAKIRIRDAVLPYAASLTENAKNAGEAFEILKNSENDVENFVKDTVLKLGYSYDVSVSLCEEYYPVRYYDSFAFPAGTYKSLKIVLGEGTGKNWWCVLYPSVCTSLSSEVPEKLTLAGVSSETVSFVCSDDADVEYGLYILELFGSLKNKLK